jgi:hypothetical protein
LQLLTDLPDVMDTLNHNIRANLAMLPETSSCRALPLRWGTEDWTSEEIDASSVRVLLVADCVYWEEVRMNDGKYARRAICVTYARAQLFEPLLDTLKQFVSRGAVCYMSHVRRWKRDTRFFTLCRKHMQVKCTLDCALYD